MWETVRVDGEVRALAQLAYMVKPVARRIVLGAFLTELSAHKVAKPRNFSKNYAKSLTPAGQSIHSRMIYSAHYS
jgi:hypothetical protein